MHLSVRHLKAKKNPAVFILKKNQKKTNHKQVLVYLKIHQVHAKPKKPKQVRESNLHKGHQFQGNNIVHSSQMLCSFTADSSHKIGPDFLFPAFLAYFLPLSCWRAAGWTSGSQPKSTHHRISTVWQLKSKVLFANRGLAGVQISALSKSWSPHILIQQFLIQQFNLSELSMRDLHWILHNL